MAEYSGRDKRLQYLFDAVENVQVDDMTGASASTDGAHGLVPAPLAGDEDKYLKGDGTWAAVQAGAGALSGLSDVELTSPTDGQALVYDANNDEWVNGNVSGGTLVIQDASIYSEDEQQVGVWIDGKPLYERTFDLGSDVSISYNTLTNTTIDASNMQTLVNAWGLYSTGVTKYSLMANISNNVIRLQTDRNGADASVRYVILQYTKTTDAAGSGGYKAYGLSPIIYSTEEREVGVWIDGKPLYQKTWLGLSLTVGLDWVNAVAIADVDNLVCTIPASNFGERCLQSQYYNGYIQLCTPYGTASSGTQSVQRLTAQYTKTTDTAGSGTWTTTGEYAHHYSTTEQVIGTWVDGKPLYERTFVDAINIGPQSGSYTKNITISVENVDDIPYIELYATRVTTLGHTWTQMGTRNNNFEITFADFLVSATGVTFNSVSFPANLGWVGVKDLYITIRYTKTTD